MIKINNTLNELGVYTKKRAAVGRSFFKLYISYENIISEY